MQAKKTKPDTQDNLVSTYVTVRITKESSLSEMNLRYSNGYDKVEILITPSEFENKETLFQTLMNRLNERLEKKIPIALCIGQEEIREGDQDTLLPSHDLNYLATYLLKLSLPTETARQLKKTCEIDYQNKSLLFYRHYSNILLLQDTQLQPFQLQSLILSEKALEL